jgi:malate/lactate dehydrogenase
VSDDARMKVGSIGMGWVLAVRHSSRARGICLSLPAIVGRNGAVEVLEPDLDDAERASLAQSAQVLQRARSSI